jgi:sulfite reductase beta subunit-like hemoprotein
MFVGNKAYTDLPRKFNVTITACKEACTHAEAQDIALTPATKEINGEERFPGSRQLNKRFGEMANKWLAWV